MKIQDKELVDNVFSKRVAVLLFEYYTLQIFNEYIELTDDKKMYQKINVKGKVSSMLNNEDENVEDLDKITSLYELNSTDITESIKGQIGTQRKMYVFKK